MIDAREAQRLVGESLRDIGILVLVFGPLDAFFEPRPPGPVFLTLAVGAGLCCIVLGIILEASKQGAPS
jgi:hypothetical protein